MKVIVTGAAGFIGMHTSLRFLSEDYEVLGIDSLNDYYDINLKHARLEELKKNKNFRFLKVNISNTTDVSKVFKEFKPNIIVNLAAQAGVRYSLENPYEYVDSNITGFLNILEASKEINLSHLVYASSSSVYGLNTKLPFSENHNVDHPISLYAASKKSNELFAHAYSHLFNIPTTGLRFFTVYGPWGRPDMALFLFTKAILNKKPIDIFNHGHMVRDFTYIDDIVEGIFKVSKKSAEPVFKEGDFLTSPSKSSAPFRVFNIGNSNPVNLIDYIQVLENELEIEAIKNYLPMQLGDVASTQADTSELKMWTGYKPSTKIDVGIKEFVKWYRNYYCI